MTEIRSVDAILQLASRPGIGSTLVPAVEDGNVAVQDRVEISDLARVLSEGLAEPGIRTDLVARVKAAIKQGDYLTTDKLEFAVGRAIEEALGEQPK